MRMRTVFWEVDQLKLIDQRRLPARLEVAGFSAVQDVADAIRSMVVRGAPAIGVTAAFGLALAARESRANDKIGLLLDLEVAAKLLRAARPTAVNLDWAVSRMLVRAREFNGNVVDLCASFSRKSRHVQGALTITNHHDPFSIEDIQ